MELSVKIFIFSFLGLVLQIVGQRNPNRINLQVLEAEAGKSVTIKCPIEPDTSHFSLVWTLGCERENLAHQNQYENRTKLGELNMEMTITNLAEDDSGIYICQLNNGLKVVEAGVALEVTTTPDPSGDDFADANENKTWSTTYIIVGLETCIIIILLAVLIKYRFSGNSEEENKVSKVKTSSISVQYAHCQDSPLLPAEVVIRRPQLKEEVELQELYYAEVSITRINQRLRTKGPEETTTYTAIKLQE
ncbi:uncharacterized protein ACNLHF_000546 [Anomaloglossus baeobatrachus]|uniref:uncharacterized protein LOC142250364 n=1 Tax=Anomaloglossus baeobatrachus TaxID=238106 RepID=UPI003F50775E